MEGIKLKNVINILLLAIRLFIGILLWIFIFLPTKVISPYLYKLLFQNKYYKQKENLSEEEDKEIKDKWLSFMHQYNVLQEYQVECTETLEYFAKLDKNILFDAEKNNPQYIHIQHVFHIISLAKEALEHLKEVTADEKKIAYYEENKKRSLDDLIELYIQKLNAKNEHKLSTNASKNEVRLKKYLVKLKKHDTLFINFYLMLYTVVPMENIMTKEKDKEDLELFKDLFEFFRIGHATSNQIYKSVVIQLYNLYKANISQIDLPSNTTDTKLKEEIGKLINYLFQTDKPFSNFNNIEQEAYVKNVIYNFPLFECDERLSKKQVRRFKFYFIGKNKLVPKYIPKFIRKLFLNKMLKTPLSNYQTMVSITLFGLFQKKI